MLKFCVNEEYLCCDVLHILVVEIFEEIFGFNTHGEHSHRHYSVFLIVFFLLHQLVVNIHYGLTRNTTDFDDVSRPNILVQDCKKCLA